MLVSVSGLIEVRRGIILTLVIKVQCCQPSMTRVMMCDVFTCVLDGGQVCRRVIKYCYSTRTFGKDGN